MKLVYQLLAVFSFVLVVSCGNSASDKTKTDDTTVSTTTTEVDNTVVTIDPPATAKTGFEKTYPQASNIRWNYHRPEIAVIDWDWSGWPAIDTSDYVANFTWNGNEYWAWYDQDGNWIGTVNRVADHSTLPVAVRNSIETQYKGYTIISVDMENDKNRTAYEVQLESGADKMKILFDENGKVLKSKKVDS